MAIILPEYRWPFWREEVVRGLREQFLRPQIRELERGLREIQEEIRRMPLISPTARREMLRGALMGFGEALARAREAALREARAMYAPRFEAARQRALVEFGALERARQAALERAWRTRERIAGQEWRAAQEALEREWRTAERLGMQEWRARMAELERQWRTAEAEKQRAWQAGQAELARQWQAEQNRLEREMQEEIARQEAVGMMWSGLGTLAGMGLAALFGGG